MRIFVRILGGIMNHRKFNRIMVVLLGLCTIGVPFRNADAPKESTPPKAMALLVALDDPARMSIMGSVPEELWLEIFRVFHDKEKISQQDIAKWHLNEGGRAPEFSFQQWEFTWRKLVARANYTFPPIIVPNGSKVTGSTLIELYHRPLELRESDQWLPQE